MEGLTIFGGKGFVLGQYVKDHYDPAIANIVSVNDKEDYEVHSRDVLYGISTVHNYNVFDEPYLDIDTNLTLLIEVLENWKSKPYSKDGVFNFVSSWFVYGDTDSPLGVKETDNCNPKGFYSITKRCAEQLLVSYCETFGLKYRILRLGNIVGPGDTKVSNKKNALQHLINKIKKNENIEVYGDGRFYRDYVHVEDCSRAVELVLSSGELNSIYNIGNGKTWTFIDILRYAKEQLKSSSEIVFVEQKDFHKKVQVVSFYFNVDKLNSLGYTPLYREEKLYRSLLNEDPSSCGQCTT